MGTEHTIDRTAPQPADALAHRWNDAARDRVTLNFARAVFVFALAFHLWGISVSWNSGQLLGNEFRQSQTAVTTLFVQRENNFSLAYPTPVLGKPWSVPMEFPLYQWTVALTSNVTGLELIQAARVVSSACFYLGLPAVWLLLRRLRLSSAQRWICLGVILTCPLYVLYARAFLIETMALMFSLWFLQAFVAAVQDRSAFWLAVANVAGIGAGLVKVTTFMLYLAPAGLLSAFWLWRQVRASQPVKGELLATFLWIAGCSLAPFAATLWWIHLADAIKSLNPSGMQLMSSSMSGYHFGTWAVRTSSEPWLSHWRTLITNVTTIPGLALLGVLMLWTRNPWRVWAIAAVALFVAAPLTFPVLYAWHEYYFVANAIFLMAAFGLGLAGACTSGSRRWAAWSLVIGFHALQIWGYSRHLYPEQHVPHQGGSGLTRLLRDVTDPQDVLLIAGNDWSSVIPFYSERRALMIRTNLEKDGEYLRRAFASLADESVPVLIMVGAMRENQALLDQVVRAFALDPKPFLIHKDQTVYVSRAWRQVYAQRLYNVVYNDVVLANPGERLRSDEPQPVSTIRSKRFFVRMNPLPDRYQVPFGVSFGFRPDGNLVFDAHATTRLWFHAPPQAKALEIEFGIADEAFTRAGDKTDGVEFVVTRQIHGGGKQELFTRFLNPVQRPEDRDMQRVSIPLSLAADDEVVVETRPGPSGSNAFDWAYWSKIHFR